MPTSNKIQALYQELKAHYGQPAEQWQLWCRRPKTPWEREEVLIGAILTQRTNWRNVGMAIDNLKKAKLCSLKKIYQLGKKCKINKLSALIKSAGFYQQKANYLFGLAGLVIQKYGDVTAMSRAPLDSLRQELLDLKGIGPETADSILLYGLDKPIFVIDEYTRRLALKRHLARQIDYAHLQKLFEENLKKDFRLFQDFHALIVIDGKKA